MDCDRRIKELKAFDGTKAGVKGLVDAGILNIPKIFIRPPEELAADQLKCHDQVNKFKVPVIDLDGVGDDRREQIVDQVRIASETWGFFQVVNHGIPFNVLEEMIKGIRMFNEQDLEVKKVWYSRDRKRNVRYNSNFDLYQSRSANWRDTLAISTLVRNELDPVEVPEICRDSTAEYVENVAKLGDTLFDILSMALGLKPEHLQEMGCARGSSIACHYYPSCPQPELTLGTSRHSDPAFLTILLQDQIGGLQVFRQNQWVEVEPIPGSLVINIGDFLQVMSNDKFKSIDHRVAASAVGPRISVAYFFTGHATETSKPYGPIKQLTSEENPPIYKEFVISEYLRKYFFSRGLDEKPGFYQLKL